MKRKFNLFKNKALVFVVIGVLVFSSVGFVLAYNKIAQVSGNPPENITAEGNDQDDDFEVRKFFQNIPAGSRIGQNGVLYTQKGASPLDLQISFKGKIDINPDLAYVDVMLLMDRSNSMKEDVGSLGDEDCIFKGFDPDSKEGEDGQDNYVDEKKLDELNNSKLCWAERAAREFIDLAGNDKGRFKIGYVTYGNEDKTKREINNPNGWKGDAQYFKPLTDTWGDENSGKRSEIKDWIRNIGFHSGYSGTAMAKATDIALEELKNNGRTQVGVEKYIIILTDGIGGMQSGYNYNRDGLSAMTGCMSFRDSPTDVWPTGYPSKGFTPCDVPTGELTFPFPPIYNDCCITSDKGVKEAFKVLDADGNGINRPVGTYNFDKSPVGILLDRNIKAPTIAFAKKKQEDTRVNKQLLENIANESHKNDGEKHYYLSETPEDIMSAFKDIFFSMFDKGALINFQETLPAGVDVDIGNIEIWRNAVDPGFCDPNNRCRKPYKIITSGQSGGNNIRVDKETVDGRIVLKFEIVNSNYDDIIPFDEETFVVRLNNLNTSGASASVFDIDQNRDCECRGEPCAEGAPVSSIEWRFEWPREDGGQYVRKRMPKLCVEFRAAQYTGDVYGLGVGRYDFPFIDVLVSGAGIVPGSQAVWELSEYKFSDTSFSNFGKYQKHLDSQIDGLIQKAGPPTNNINSALQLPTGPEGKIFYVSGNQTLNDPATMNGRRTVIVDGDLTINANISKAGKDRARSTAAIIVLGDVEILNSRDLSIEAGIVSHKGVITIGKTSNYLDILGFLIGSKVNLKGLNQSVTQSINYDINLAKFPPPGLTNLNLPIYQEVAP